MSMHGSYLEERKPDGTIRKVSKGGMDSYISCFAGLGRGHDSPVQAENTVMHSLLQGFLGNANRIGRDIQEAFLGGEFVQRLTDHAILGMRDAKHNDIHPIWGGHEQTLAESFGRYSEERIHQSFWVTFDPNRHQDLLVTAFRISAYHKKIGGDDWCHLPEDLWEFIPLAAALKDSYGEGYCDSAVIFCTPTKKHILNRMEEEGCDSVSDLYYEDEANDYSRLGNGDHTIEAVLEMFSRSTEEFKGLCRAGMGDLLSGYAKDDELDTIMFDGLRDDDPMGLAAPMRIRPPKDGEQHINRMSIRDICIALKQANK